MNQLLQAFVLGAGNMINPCVLPLYPGFLAYLANNSVGRPDRQQTARWLGLIVLAGVLTSMLAVGFLLAVLQVAVGQVLALLLPIVYAIVIGMGVLLILQRNPLARLPALRAPHLRHPALSAFAYGTLYGPMTLPCCGPLVVGVFALGITDVGSVLNGMSYFLAFGLGFGLPLLIWPLLTVPFRKALLTRLLAHHALLARLAGVLLIAIGLSGIYSDWDLLHTYLHL